MTTPNRDTMQHTGRRDGPSRRRGDSATDFPTQSRITVGQRRTLREIGEGRWVYSIAMEAWRWAAVRTMPPGLLERQRGEYVGRYRRTPAGTAAIGGDGR